MVRISIVHLLLFLTPFVVYGLYWWFVVRHKDEPGQAERAVPWVVLVVAGVLLAGASFIYTAVNSGFRSEGEFVPARYEDGRLVPGHREQQDEP